MDCLSDGYLLITSAVVTPSSVLRFPFNTSTQNIRELECWISASLFDINGGINELIGEGISRSDDLVLTEHASNRFRRNSRKPMI